MSTPDRAPSTPSKLQEICHFLPGKYTCMDYDKEKGLIAVGCDTGEIAILGEDISFFSAHPTCSVKIVSFAVGKGLLLVIAKNDSKFYLWNVNTKKLEHFKISEELFENSKAPVPHATCVTWSPKHNFFYVGTDVGTVKTLIVQATETDDTKYELVWGSVSFTPESFKEPFNGNVIAIQEKISDKVKGGEVLLLSSYGHCVLWTWSPGEPSTSTCKKVANNNSLISVWWSPSGNKVTAEKKGVITVIKAVLNTTFNCGENDTTLCIIKPVKLGINEDVKWLIYASESTEKEVKKSHYTISLQTVVPISEVDKSLKVISKPLVSFGGEIIDIECLATDKVDTSVLAVLTENELVVLEIKNEVNFEDISARQSNRYPYLTSPVTSLQHCGHCTKYFMKTHHLVRSQDQSDKNELIATGHCDGSVRLWLCSRVSSDSPVSFKCALVVYTADYFDFTQLDDAMKEITLVKVTKSQKFMNVVNKCGRVLLFEFSQKQRDNKKPQSHEIILKDDKKSDNSLTTTPKPEASISSTPLQTPSPYFHPCQWQSSRVQILQHFSCYYQDQPGREPDLVTVNCVDFKNVIWFIGTGKGLVILDFEENKLLDVIGSEKKLLGKSGFKHSTHTRSASADNCDVLCVKIIPEIRLTQEAIAADQAQTSLWVGTAGRALGVFTISDADILQKTDEGVIKKNDIVDILCCRPSESENVYVVVVSNKKVKCSVYPEGKVHKIGSDNAIKSGIVSDKDGIPYLVTLNSNGKFRLVTLPQLTLTLYDDRVMQGKPRRNSAGKVLFSSGGQHIVWCTENAVNFCYPFTSSAVQKERTPE